MSDKELKREFQELCQENHPDRLAGEEMLAGIIKLVEGIVSEDPLTLC